MFMGLGLDNSQNLSAALAIGHNHYRESQFDGNVHDRDSDESEDSSTENEAAIASDTKRRGRAASHSPGVRGGKHNFGSLSR